ncbi:ubiquitin-like protein, putative, partial [Trypanosoma cruzi marinkellei]
MVLLSSSTSFSSAHTYGQQHRASTNRAHSRRHVVIIVSVVVQWCGADLHSEEHGEQQGRREVRQTHTEGTPHKERAAARHAPYAAHHARHTQPYRNTNTQMEEGEANRSGTQGSTACTHGESGPSCLHLSRRAHTHARGSAAPTARENQGNNEKGMIPAHHVNRWTTGSAANIHHKNNKSPFVIFYTQRTSPLAGMTTG